MCDNYNVFLIHEMMIAKKEGNAKCDASLRLRLRHGIMNHIL